MEMGWDVMTSLVLDAGDTLFRVTVAEGVACKSPCCVVVRAAVLLQDSSAPSLIGIVFILNIFT